MKLLSIFLLISLIAALNGCELIRIGAKPINKEVIDAAQDTPAGAVYLFKIELDSSNVTAASRILADISGRHYLAVERYENYLEIARMKRLMSSKPITYISLDTISENKRKVHLELDYIRIVSFKTEKISDYWFITDYTEKKYNQ